MIKAIIADNEECAMGRMESMLSDIWPDLVVCGKAESGPEALHMIKQHAPQLAFMEVRLPGICGMQVARMIPESCQVVFTTSNGRYAVNAFDGGVLDYLLKPVSRERLQKAIRRAKRQLAFSLNTPPPGDGSPAEQGRNGRTPENMNCLQWICTQNGRRSRLIPVGQVCYFKADHKYTAVITREDENLINKSIKCLADELASDRFWRIHRATIVNVNQIQDVSRSRTGRGALRLKDRPEILTVSRPYLHLFKQM